MADDRNERIRARAHAIWENEGHPHGRHEDHWNQAMQEMDSDDTRQDPSARSLGSAAQSDLIPGDASQGANRAGSLVDTGPALGLAAGSPIAGGTGGGAAGLGGLSLGQEVGHGASKDTGAPGGMSSIGSGTEDEGKTATGGRATGKAKA